MHGRQVGTMAAEISLQMANAGLQNTNPRMVQRTTSTRNHPVCLDQLRLSSEASIEEIDDHLASLPRFRQGGINKEAMPHSVPDIKFRVDTQSY